MKTYKDATLDEYGDWVNIYECKVCGLRSRYKDKIATCESIHKHKEEWENDML